MELESSLPYSQTPATCPYPVPTPSTPHNLFHFLKIHLNIILPSTSWSPQGSLSLRFPHQNLVHTSLAPYVPHAPPISFFSMLSPALYRVRSTKNHAPHYVIFSCEHGNENADIFKRLGCMYDTSEL